MDEKDCTQLKNLFVKIDTNKNGTISKQELLDYFTLNRDEFSQRHFNMDMSIFEEFILSIDQNKNDKIDYREFIAATIYKKMFSED